MRFEVKGGGIVAILFTMTLLSGAVFVLGLLAGYDVGRQAQIDTAQFATSYPLQSPSSSAGAAPAKASNPTLQPVASSVASPAAGESTPVADAAGGSPAITSVTTPNRRGSARKQSPPNNALASNAARSTVAPPSSMSGPPPADDAMSGADEDEDRGGADTSSAAVSNASPEARRKVSSTAPLARHKPYNIQIEAAMDISGADQMMARLQKLGYTSHLVPTEIGGERWYKIEVGPYATAEEASNAEAELRQRYDRVYGGVGRKNSADQTSTNEDSEE
jgi:DedD protein